MSSFLSGAVVPSLACQPGILCGRQSCRTPDQCATAWPDVICSTRPLSCVGPNIKMLKDKDLEFANSIPPFCETLPYIRIALY